MKKRRRSSEPSAEPQPFTLLVVGPDRRLRLLVEVFTGIFGLDGYTGMGTGEERALLAGTLGRMRHLRCPGALVFTPAAAYAVGDELEVARGDGGFRMAWSFASPIGWVHTFWQAARLGVVDGGPGMVDQVERWLAIVGALGVPVLPTSHARLYVGLLAERLEGAHVEAYEGLVRTKRAA